MSRFSEEDFLLLFPDKSVVAHNHLTGQSICGILDSTGVTTAKMMVDLVMPLFDSAEALIKKAKEKTPELTASLGDEILLQGLWERLDELKHAVSTPAASASAASVAGSSHIRVGGIGGSGAGSQGEYGAGVGVGAGGGGSSTMGSVVQVVVKPKTFLADTEATFHAKGFYVLKMEQQLDKSSVAGLSSAIDTVVANSGSTVGTAKPDSAQLTAHAAELNRSFDLTALFQGAYPDASSAQQKGTSAVGEGNVVAGKKIQPSNHRWTNTLVSPLFNAKTPREKWDRVMTGTEKRKSWSGGEKLTFSVGDGWR